MNERSGLDRSKASLHERMDEFDPCLDRDLDRFVLETVSRSDLDDPHRLDFELHSGSSGAKVTRSTPGWTISPS